MDVPMAVCITVMLGKLSHIATGDQIAPWREPLSCSMSGAVSASLALLSSRVFCSICRRLRRRMETQIGFVHASVTDACTNPLGLRWPCRRRPQRRQNPPTASCAKVKILISRVSHVEMPTPNIRESAVAYSYTSRILIPLRNESVG